MDVPFTNWILGAVSAFIALVFALFLPIRRVWMVPVICPPIAPLCFWVIQYCCAFGPNSLNTRHWIVLFTVFGLAQSYLIAAPVGVITIFVRLRFRRTHAPSDATSPPDDTRNA